MKYSPPIPKLGLIPDAAKMFEAILATYERYPSERLIKLGGVILDGTSYEDLMERDATGILTATKPLVDALDPMDFKQRPSRFHSRIGIYLHRGDAFNRGFDVRRWHRDGITGGDTVGITTNSDPTEELIGEYRLSSDGAIVPKPGARMRQLAPDTAYALHGNNVHRRPAIISSPDRIFAAATFSMISLGHAASDLEIEPVLEFSPEAQADVLLHNS